MNEAIAHWLTSEKDYSSGLSIYLHYNKNSKQARILSIGGATPKNQKTLIYELSKLHKQPKPVSTSVTVAIAQSSISIPDYVESLKKEQKLIYKMLDNLHSVLPYQVKQKRKEIAFKILSLDDQLKDIAQRFVYYEKHGVLPPKEVKPELSVAELISRQMTLRTYVSREKRLISEGTTLSAIATHRERLEKYQLELDDVNKKLTK